MNVRGLVSRIPQLRSILSEISELSHRSRSLRLPINPHRALCALIVLALANVLWAGDKPAQVRHTIIAQSGTAAPSGENYVALIDPPVSNERGEVAFDAFLGGPNHSGIFVNRGKTTSAFALGGNLAGGQFQFVFSPTLTSRGDAIFFSDLGIFRADGKHTVPLVHNGDPAPGGGSLTPSSNFVANPRGVIAYNGFVTGGESSDGIFRTEGAHTVAIAFDGAAAPTGGNFNFFGAPVIDERGRVAFTAGMDGGSADFALFRGDGETLTTVFAANQPAPGGGTFQDFGTPAMNEHGEVLALALLNKQEGPIGLFLGNGKDTVAIALSGGAAPKGGSYCRPTDPGCPSAVQFPTTNVLNDRGQAAFTVFLTGGNSRSGIFRGDGRKTVAIALEGTEAPGTASVFDSFVDLRMDEDGRVIFIGRLALGVGGVDTSNNVGIWVGQSEEDLQLVARTGQIIDGKTLIGFQALGQPGNDRKVIWVARFAPFTTAIISSALDCESDQN